MTEADLEMLPTYKTAAQAAGWSVKRVEDGYGATEVEWYAWRGGTEKEPEAETSMAEHEIDAWHMACEYDGLKPQC